MSYSQQPNGRHVMRYFQPFTYRDPKANSPMPREIEWCVDRTRSQDTGHYIPCPFFCWQKEGYRFSSRPSLIFSVMHWQNHGLGKAFGFREGKVCVSIRSLCNTNNQNMIHSKLKKFQITSLASITKKSRGRIGFRAQIMKL